MVTYDPENLAKHGITVTETDEVLQDPRSIWLDLGASHNGNDRLMFVRLTKAGRALEVGVELTEQDEHVFHAMDAGKGYLKEFNNAHKRNARRQKRTP